jgi:hypothetical protein
MTSSLQSPRITLSDAKDYIEEFKAAEAAFFETEPYQLMIEPDPLYPGRRLQYLRLAKPLPRRISVRAGDAAKTLRVALDHLGASVAWAIGKSGKKANFPFGDTAAELENRRTTNSKQLPKEIFDLMIAFKPYEGGNDALWWLNKLANDAKHENPIRAVLFASRLTYQCPGISLDVGPAQQAHTIPDRIKASAPIAREIPFGIASPTGEKNAYVAP